MSNSCFFRIPSMKIEDLATYSLYNCKNCSVNYTKCVFLSLNITNIQKLCSVCVYLIYIYSQHRLSLKLEPKSGAHGPGLLFIILYTRAVGTGLYSIHTVWSLMRPRGTRTSTELQSGLYTFHLQVKPQKKDKYRRKGKGRQCGFGGKNLLNSLPGQLFCLGRF